MQTQPQPQPKFYAAPYLYDCNTVEYGVFVRGGSKHPLICGFRTIEEAEREAALENGASNG